MKTAILIVATPIILALSLLFYLIRRGIKEDKDNNNTGQKWATKEERNHFENK
jgi:hypothetical protein